MAAAIGALKMSGDDFAIASRVRRDWAQEVGPARLGKAMQCMHACTSFGYLFMFNSFPMLLLPLLTPMCCPPRHVKYLLESLVAAEGEQVDVAHCGVQCGSTSTGGAEAIEEEIEAVQAIYGENVVVTRDDSLQLSLSLESTGLPGPLVLRVKIPPGCTYPESPPLLFIESSLLPAHVRLALLAGLYRFAKESVGAPMIFALACWVHEHAPAVLASPPPLTALRQTPASGGGLAGRAGLGTDGRGSETVRRVRGGDLAARASENVGHLYVCLAAVACLRHYCLRFQLPLPLICSVLTAYFHLIFLASLYSFFFSSTPSYVFIYILLQASREQGRLQRQARLLAGAPITAARARLPVASFREEIMAAIRANPVVVVCGETGCGKTTQVPSSLE